ncbi:MAG TPA: hypothetical protein VFX49_14740, partial [Chloroflexota bacterium]|nr:hypothetical protein [Chloroflexota bacterium]
GEFGEKVLITVLFSRTLPLIRYELSDSVRRAPERCGCGRPFGLLSGVQGRVEDILELPARGGRDGATVRVHPHVFHRIMDAVPAAGWQVVQEPAGLRLRVVPRDAGEIDTSALGASIRGAIESQGPPACRSGWSAWRPSRAPLPGRRRSSSRGALASLDDRATRSRASARRAPPETRGVTGLGRAPRRGIRRRGIGRRGAREATEKP